RTVRGFPRVLRGGLKLLALAQSGIGTGATGGPSGCSFVSCLGAQIGLMSNRVPPVNSPLLTRRLQFRVAFGELETISSLPATPLNARRRESSSRRCVFSASFPLICDSSRVRAAG